MTKGNRKEPGSRPEASRSGFSFGGLGSIMDGLGRLLEAVTEAAEKGEAVTRTGTLPGSDKDIRGVYGFTIRTLAGSKSAVRPFGNVRKTPQGPVIDEVRQPLADVFEEKDRLRVVAELAGCEQKDVRTELKGDILVIRADTGDRKYFGEVLLPCPVDESSLRSFYRNGVLEIELLKRTK